MALLWIGIAIGVLIAVILIVKAIKTPSRDVVGIELHCRKCGLATKGLKCPRCEKDTKSFGV